MVGCYPEFTNPLSEPLESKVDERLLGTWYIKDGKEVGYLHIERRLDNLTNITIIEGDENRVKIDKESMYTMFASKIGNSFYMNLQDDSLRENNKYVIVKYLINDKEELFIWMMDNQQFAKDIESNRLSGEVPKKRFSPAQITDSTSALTTYLSSADHSSAFYLLGKFKKIVNTSSDINVPNKRCSGLGKSAR